MKKQITQCKEGYRVTHKGTVLTPKGAPRKFKTSQQGYNSVGLPKITGGTKFFSVHRLVAEAFIPNPDNKPYVNHIDGIKTNNHLDNLEWVTPSENMLHSARVLGKGIGENNGNSILTEKVVHEICGLLEEGYRSCEIGDNLGLEHYLIGQIRSGSTWKQISEQYTFKVKSRSLSDSTVRWVCTMIQEGRPTREILQETTNKKLTKNMVKDIRRKKIYKDICEQFNY